MIINTGGRTDTVHYYTDWLLKRFEEGYVLSRNPLFTNKVTRYELTPEAVDCVVFCSKNYTPILPHIGGIAEKFNIYCYYSITAYGRDVEPGVPSIEKSVETLIQLSEIVGRKKVAWRYDPVLLTQEYTVERHLETFERLASQLAPYIDRCIFGFVEMYKKLEVNMPELEHISSEDMDQLAQRFGSIASKYGISIQTCGPSEDYSSYGINASGCMTLEILGNANGTEFRNLKHRGMREGCNCIESRDIGAYDTCVSGCKYCYANKSPRAASENYKLHDPNSPLLFGHLKTTDILQQGAQKSFLKKN